MVTLLASIKNILTDNIVIKIISLVIGYGIWLSLTQFHTSTIRVNVPLCFYGTEKAIQAPDSLMVHLSGKRYHLATVDPSSLAIHVNTDSLHAGPNQLNLDNSYLFLPKTINVVHWSPVPVIVTVLDENEQTIITEIKT